MRALLALSIVLFLLISACGDDGGPSETFVNPGFEEGKTGWTSLDTDVWFPDFAISTEVVHEGTQAAHLEMRPEADEETLIFGVTQEVSPEEFPEQLSGWYRVENWQRETPIQYMQAVVIAWEAENRPPAYNNHQIRYILNGISSPPFRIDNAKYIFLGENEPPQDEWIHFSVDVKQDFLDQWGAVPEGYDFIRVLFEVRYDGRTPEQQPHADVYYDDLHFGKGRDEDSDGE